ncbi:hypothetical protein JXB01_04135 [Candidatus Micrarchaeota archaeon]|nr:hypothetical protein [Candidatus Micrarchaeota archaeon]
MERWLVAAVLIALVLIGFSVYTAPVEDTSLTDVGPKNIEEELPPKEETGPDAGLVKLTAEVEEEKATSGGEEETVPSAGGDEASESEADDYIVPSSGGGSGSLSSPTYGGDSGSSGPSTGDSDDDDETTTCSWSNEVPPAFESSLDDAIRVRYSCEDEDGENYYLKSSIEWGVYWIEDPNIWPVQESHKLHYVEDECGSESYLLEATCNEDGKPVIIKVFCPCSDGRCTMKMD